MLFVVLNNFADWESAYLSTALTEQGVLVETVSLTQEPIKSLGNFTVIPDYELDNVPKTFSGLVLIGGTEWQNKESLRVLKLVDLAIAMNVPIGAICAASELLAVNGYLNNHKHTSNGLESIIKWNENHYEGSLLYKNEQSVRDDIFITANGTATLEFTRNFMYAMNIVENTEIEEAYQFDKIGYVDLMKLKKL